MLLPPRRVERAWDGKEHLEERNHLDRGARRSARGHLRRVRCEAIPHHVVQPDQGRRRLAVRSLAGRPQGAARRERQQWCRGAAGRRRTARARRAMPVLPALLARTARTATSRSAGAAGRTGRRAMLRSDRRTWQGRQRERRDLPGRGAVRPVLERRRLGRLRAVQRGERPNARPDHAALVHGRMFDSATGRRPIGAPYLRIFLNSGKKVIFDATKCATAIPDEGRVRHIPGPGRERALRRRLVRRRRRSTTSRAGPAGQQSWATVLAAPWLGSRERHLRERPAHRRG